MHDGAGMPFENLFVLDSPASWLAWFLLLALAMYFARIPAHRAILSLTGTIRRSLRLAARSILLAEPRLSARNREVLLAAGREAKERIVEREFERIANQVRRDLAECPTLNRKLGERVTRLEEDHDESKIVPPTPPGWTRAVEAVAGIDAKGDPMVAKVLGAIHDSMVKAQDQARDEFRKTIQERHQRLKDILPHWRRSIQLLGQVEGKVTRLLERTQIIDRHIDEYESILKQSDRAERMLSSSSFVQFFVSLFVLCIAVGGAIINFNLIARPMAEMVGGTNFIGTWRVADIAALVIILVEISMGLFLMESLRITRLFPIIGALPDKWRLIMVWVTLGLLTSLASVEAGLAYMREVLLQDELATSALLRGDQGVPAASEYTWITTAAQMGMGFVLPFALTFVAIPLESFVHSLRTVLGVAAIGFLRGLAAVLRIIGSGCGHLGRFLVDVYDVVIFLPLWVEQQARGHANGAGKPARGGGDTIIAAAAPGPTGGPPAKTPRTSAKDSKSKESQA